MINKIHSQDVNLVRNISQNNEKSKPSSTQKAQSNEESKFASIAKSIKDGTYQIDIKKTAEAVANELI